MPRKERLFIPGALYHVYCRTARGERVLSKETEAAAFLETLVAVRDLHGLTFLAWCFMSNHYHLVLRTSDVPLWRSMARIQGRFAREFNRRHRYLPHVPDRSTAHRRIHATLTSSAGRSLA